MDTQPESGVARRVALSYAADLLTAISAVLICSRLLTPWPYFEAHPLLPVTFADAINRFTPFGLWNAYQDVMNGVLQDYIHTGASGPLSATWISLQMIGSLLIAIPEAMLTIFQTSDGIYTWGCVAAFLVTASAFVLSLAGGRPSPLRLFLAAMIAPVLTSALFWLTEQLAIDAVNTLAWFVRMLPWCLPCPVICTLWWICFPRAPHGATVTLVLWLHRGWVAFVRRRRRTTTALVGSRPH